MLPPAIILAAPQMGENIGASARVMKNFAMTDLRIVSPRDGWPNAKAEEMSAGATDVLHTSQVHESLPRAAHDLQHLYAFCPRHREIEKSHLSVRDAMTDLLQRQQRGERTALVFGNERAGLSNEEISHCHTLVTIPVSPEYPSLNLAQAVGIACYAYSAAAQVGSVHPYAKPHEDFTPSPRATAADVAHLMTALEAVFLQSGVVKSPDRQERTLLNLRATLQRIEFNAQDVRTLRGLLKIFSTSQKGV